MQPPPPARLRVPAPPAGRSPTVIEDVGLDAAGTRRAARLPAAVTLAFLPYGNDVAALAAEARRGGHELLVHVPMQPWPHDRPIDPGPNALMVDLAPAELARRIDWNLGRFQGFVGVNNHMGSRFTEHEPGMRLVIAELARRGLLFLDSRTSARSVGLRLAHEAGIPALGRDVFLDHERARPAIRAQLDRVAEIARRNGVAIAIGHPYAETLDVLEAWLPTLKGQRLELVPLTRLVTRVPGG